MKVISGIYKGRTIKGYDMDGTRPTMDRVKESLFATIQNEIKDSVVLDLFSGTGSLAIESLSQGAKIAYAIDKSKEAIKTINENIKTIGVNNCKAIMSDYKSAIISFKNQQLKFDIVFLDPPYKTDDIEKSLNLIIENDILKDTGLIVCETDDLDKIIYPESLKEVKSKKYGDIRVVILEKV